jgi:TetR/AcrR family transcriptional repressor of mexJK operon
MLASAHALLFKRGPSAVSIEAVARRAGLSKMTVYSRYTNREALIAAVIQRQAARMAVSLSFAPESHRNIQEALTTFGVRLLSFLLSETHLGFLRALRSATTFPTNAMRTIFRFGPQSTLDNLAQWMRQAHRAKLAHISRPERSAELLLGMLTGLDIVRAMYGEPCRQTPRTITRHVRRVVQLFLTLHGRRP